MTSYMFEKRSSYTSFEKLRCQEATAMVADTSIIIANNYCQKTGFQRHNHYPEYHQY